MAKILQVVITLLAPGRSRTILVPVRATTSNLQISFNKTHHFQILFNKDKQIPIFKKKAEFQALQNLLCLPNFPLHFSKGFEMLAPGPSRATWHMRQVNPDVRLCYLLFCWQCRTILESSQVFAELFRARVRLTCSLHVAIHTAYQQIGKENII